MSDFKALPTGIYNISPTNNHPGPVPGGMYVTGVGRGMPVITSAQRPPQFEHQKWHVYRNGETDRYIIKFVELNMPERGGFTWDRITQGSPVVLEEPKQFTISPIEGDENVYIIRPVSPTPGVDICVGINHYNQLEFVFFPIHAPIEARPLWRFTRLPLH